MTFDLIYYDGYANGIAVLVNTSFDDCIETAIKLKENNGNKWFKLEIVPYTEW